jgi:hypothetical protein
MFHYDRTTVMRNDLVDGKLAKHKELGKGQGQEDEVEVMRTRMRARIRIRMNIQATTRVLLFAGGHLCPEVSLPLFKQFSADLIRILAERIVKTKLEEARFGISRESTRIAFLSRTRYQSRS